MAVIDIVPSDGSLPDEGGPDLAALHRELLERSFDARECIGAALAAPTVRSLEDLRNAVHAYLDEEARFLAAAPSVGPTETAQLEDGHERIRVAVNGVVWSSSSVEQRVEALRHVFLQHFDSFLSVAART